MWLIWNHFNGDIPKYISDFEVMKNSQGLYFIKAEHLNERHYTRLDRHLENCSTVAQIQQLRKALYELKDNLERDGLSYGDVAPTNIFIENSRNRACLVDLDTLYMPGCFPHKEGGHPGMYGDKNAGACAPSLMMHKLPFLVLDLTLSIIESKGQKISEFLKKLYDEVGQSQEYILPHKETCRLQCRETTSWTGRNSWASSYDY